MNLVFFAHPSFLNQQSMPRYAQMLAEGMRERGHQVQLWQPKPYFSRLKFLESKQKWAGYIDQYVLFPQEVKKRLKQCPANTLFVFTDHALGPWVPLVADHPRVIHCHDFLAQRSALGEIPQNPTGWSGRQYQTLIRRGYLKGNNFISVSQKTQEDLHRFLPFTPLRSEVVYNGLNQSFEPKDPVETRILLQNLTGIDLRQGYLLHVGGNSWYKNREGVIHLYNAWRKMGATLPLLMIGQNPTAAIEELYTQSAYTSDIHFLSNIDDKFLRLAYAGASLLLFPSLAEGFGWPIAEAMASGCPVITTNEAPMTEVGGEAAFYIPLQPNESIKTETWANKSAKTIAMVLNLTPLQRQKVITAGLLNAKRFDPEIALDKIESIYVQICQIN